MNSPVVYASNALEKFFVSRRTCWHKVMMSFFSKIGVQPVGYIVDNILFRSQWINIWEPKVTNLLKRTKGKLFLDIGACYGRYSLLLAKNYEKILTIEPEPSNVKTIIANLAYSHIENVTALNVAISDKEGGCGMKKSFRFDSFRFAYKGEKPDIIVRTITLTTLLKNRIADLVKVDAEGAEFHVLNGAVPVLKQIKSWVVELHDLARKSELEQWFFVHRYSVSWIDENHVIALRENARV